MVEELSNRPAGGREGDFGELGDWTITDIATAPKTAPEDRKNAEAEIAKREEAGVYNPDDAPQEVYSDLLSHGYSVRDGKILYPKPKYKTWLESDRKKPAPRGEIRESIEDRLEVERKEAEEAHEAANAERRRELNRAAGEATLEAYEGKYGDAPARVRIQRPSRPASEESGRGLELGANKKAADQEIAERRKFKESNKYENNYLNPLKKADAEARANLPTAEVAGEPAEKKRDSKSVEERVEKLYNYYSKSFSKKAQKWVSFGVSSLLEKGVVDPPMDSLLRSGFWTCEDDRIHERIDPDDVLSPETIDAEADLKTRVSQDLITKEAETVLEDNLYSAKRDGLLYAISSGAHMNKRSGKVVFSVPLEQSEKVAGFMDKIGLDPSSESARNASFDGFINIIDSIKNSKQATPKGFEALDWYFDTFSYGKDFAKPGGVLDVMYGYSSISDMAWSQKLDEYLRTRPEFMEYQEELDQNGQHEDDVDAHGEISPVSEEDYRKQVADALNISLEDLENAELSASFILGKVLPPEPTNRIVSQKGGNGSFHYPRLFGQQKILATYATYALLKKTGRDPGAEIFQEKIGGEKYTILRFGCKNDEGTIEENHAIAEGHSPASATYIWHGQGKDGWRVIIQRYKSVVKKYPGVSSKNHDHSMTPVDHITEIMAGLGIDLKALADQLMNEYEGPSKEEHIS